MTAFNLQMVEKVAFLTLFLIAIAVTIHDTYRRGG
jgi:hypothetical protein